MAEVALEGIGKRYGATAALADIDLTVRDGEFFTLVGPSGCGKTTTLRLIAGFEAPTVGTVRIGGRDTAGVPPERRDVGVVFQSYALFPHMTVRENVGYGLRFRDPPDGTPAERVGELLDLVGLAGLGDRDPTALSGGQRQRVALARALAPGPDLLLLDEPMSALDARLRERLRREVRAIQRDLGVTTVYVTHDQEEALAVSDRLAVLHGGRVEQVGTPQAVYREPATRFVAEFVGENNVFDGRVVGDDRIALKGVEATVTGALPDGAARGDRVTACVRPELLSVGGGANELTGRVAAAEFLGATVRVTLEWRGQEVVVRTDAVPAGGDLTVGFDPRDVHVLPAGGDAPGREE